MYSFGPSSKRRLETCHPDIQKVMNAVIKRRDISIFEGHRSNEKQDELYLKGRDNLGNVVNKDAVVTYLKGGESKHNAMPSNAVDVVPWPEQYDKIEAFEEIAVIIMEEANKLGVEFIWGGDFDSFKDYPHWELK